MEGAIEKPSSAPAVMATLISVVRAVPMRQTMRLVARADTIVPIVTVNDSTTAMPIGAPRSCRNKVAIRLL